MLHPKYDFQGEYLTCILFTIFVKIYRLINATIGFMLLSFINGMIVRVALLCSNVVIFPLLYMVRCITGQEMDAG